MTDSMPPPLDRNRDDEHLRLLAIFHYVVAVIGGLFACFPLIHVFIGAMIVRDPSFMHNGHKPAPPAFFGYLMMGMGGLFVLLGWAGAVCTFISGRFLATRRHRLFSFVMAALLCMFMPFGTVLGIFTIVVLSRESVQRLYAASGPGGAGGGR